VDFIPCGAHDSYFNGLWHDDDAVLVGSNQIAGTNHNPVNLDGHIEVNHTLPITAVVRTAASSEYRELHAAHLGQIANGTIDDDTDAACVAGGSGKQFSPDAGSQRTSRRAHKDVVRTARIDSCQFQLVRFRIDMGHIRPQRRSASTDQNDIRKRHHTHLHARRLTQQPGSIQRIAQQRYGKVRTHHLKRDRRVRNWIREIWHRESFGVFDV